MMDWCTALPDWERRVLARESLIPFPPLFPAEAEAALDVFRALRVADVNGSPTMGELCRPWIIDYVASVFGAYDADSGRRLITEWLLSVSKKNGKSTIAAGIMMTALIRNWRESAEFLILSPTIEIANNSFFPARDMVRKDEELSDLFLVQEHYRTITHRVNNSQLKVVAADNETVGGKKATGVLVDELWQFGLQANAENMLREACGGLASRPEGFTIFISTHADRAPSGIWKKKLDYARGVRDGSIADKRFLPLLYEYPASMLKDKSYRDPKNFYVTNPNLGASVDTEFLEREAQKAINDGADSECGFFAKHLNVEIGLALHSDRWAGADLWEKQAQPNVTLDELLARCDVVTIGIDGGGRDDLLGLAVLGRDALTGHWVLWTHAWANPVVLDRRKDIAPRLLDYSRAGDLTIVQQDADDVTQLAAVCAHVYESGLLDTIGLDPNHVEQITAEIKKAGIPEELLIAVKQGGWLTSEIKTIERRLAEGTFIHGGQTLMDWAVGNAKVVYKGNSVAITKQAAGNAKIDPLSAVLDAAHPMMRNPEAKGKSFWDTTSNARSPDKVAA